MTEVSKEAREETKAKACPLYSLKTHKQDCMFAFLFED